MKIGDTLVHGVEIDWEKRNWERILTPEEQRERADKALRLNGFAGPVTRTKTKPTIRIKRFAAAVNSVKPKLQSASRRQSVEEHLASCELCRRVVQMEKATKGLRLLTGL